MPKFYSQNLLSDKETKPEGEEQPLLETVKPEEMLPSVLDTPELEPPHAHVEPVAPAAQPTISHDQPHHDEDEHTFNDVDDDDFPHDNQNPLKIYLTWHAPARPFRKKDRSFYTTVAVLIILISLILALAGEKMLIVALFAFGFLVYVMNFIPPEDVEYRISNQGVTVGTHFYHWQQLDSFWFTEKDGFKMVHILTELRFPAVLMLVLKDVDEEDVKKIVAKYLPYHEIAPKSVIDKWSESLQKHFPLENPHK